MAITTEQGNQLLQDMQAGKMTMQDVVSIGSGYVPYGSTPPSQLTSTLVDLNDARKIYDYALQNNLTAYQVEQALNMPIGGANQWAASQGLAPIANTAEANKNVNFYANPTTWMGEAAPNQNVPVQAQQQQQTQQPSWMGQWEAMQNQFNQMMQGWQTQQQAQQPSYGYKGSNTNYNYQPVYSNPLMRPVTANANIAPQQAPSNMGYQNRTSLWSDV